MTPSTAPEPLIIGNVGQKGGVGKSTTSMNTAACLSRNSRVLVVDVDPQETATDWADLAGDNLPFDFATSINPTSLAKLKDYEYDVILIDTPGNLENEAVLEVVLEVADFVILPLNPEFSNIKPLKRTIREHIEPRELPYRILLNRIDMRVQGELDDWRGMVDQVLKMPRFQQHIRWSKSISEGPRHGKVVTQYTDTRANQNAISDYTTYGHELRSILADIQTQKGVN